MKIIQEATRNARGRIETPAVGMCDQCTALVTLDRFTNNCWACGADYNSFGQRLAPRAQWEEETGEHPTDQDHIE